MTRLKVVFSIGAMHGGGSERQLLEAMRHLDRDRFQPYLYLVYRSGELLAQVPEDVNIAAFEERSGAAGIYFPGRAHRSRVRDMRSFLTEISADVVYDRTFLMSLIAADAAQRAGVPNVSTIVTDPATGFAPVAGRFASIKRRRLGRLYRNSTRVLAVSEGVRRSAAAFYGVNADAITTHYNGVDFQRIQDEIRQGESLEANGHWRPSSEKETIRVVSAGRLNRQKGFHVLIEAVAALGRSMPEAEIELVILGEGPDRAKLEDQVRDLSLQKIVRLPGFQADAVRWYADAGVFVLPSLLEGMPNVLLEAMACGTPVVSADCPSGPSEILDRGRCGRLVPPDDSVALARGIRDVFEAPDETTRMIQAGFERVRQTFAIDASVRRLEEILIQAANTKR